MKLCGKCGQTKESGEFSARSNAKDGLQSWCKSCKRQADKSYYENSNKDVWRERNQRHREDRQRRVAEYLVFHPCVDCGEDDIVVLDFDHTDDNKEMAISMMVNQAHAWKKIKAEIEKCEVVCSNCHRRRTAQRGGHYRIKFIEEWVTLAKPLGSEPRVPQVRFLPPQLDN